MKKFYYLLLLGIGSVACNYTIREEATKPSLLPASFYFSEKGQFCVYEVENKQYALGRSVETQVYWLRYAVTSLSDSLLYKKCLIQLHIRSDTTQAWTALETTQSLVSTQVLVNIQQNTPICLLHTPLVVHNQWNSNLYNVQKPQLASIQQRYFKYQWQGKHFDEALLVTSYKDSTALANHSSRQLYLTGLGMAYQEITDVQYCYQAACAGKSQIDFGKIIRYKLIDYGKE